MLSVAELCHSYQRTIKFFRIFILLSSIVEQLFESICILLRQLDLSQAYRVSLPISEKSICPQEWQYHRDS